MKYGVATYLCWIMMTCMSLVQGLQAAPAESREYKIKAAFLYNFLKAIEWPQSHCPGENEPYTIGILGDSPFGDAFDPIHDRTVKGHAVEILYLASPNEGTQLNPLPLDSIKTCHVLFICASEHERIDEILALLDGLAVLTVAECKTFLAAGGIINFIPGANKGDFEINLTASQKAGLQISSKLLRIAKRVAED